MLSEEQVSQLKSQLIEQVKNLSPEKRKLAEEQIISMSTEAIEKMLIEQQTNSPQKNIFRMIINREVECVIIEENEEALAVLDINPISEGHTIIIPKSPSNSSKEISSKVFELSQRIATLIKNNLKAENVDIQTESKFGESIVNVIPSYKSHVSLNSERKKSSFDELRNVLKKMKPEEKPKTLRIKKSTAQLEIVKRERRIP